jgi:hypothetical protein
MEREVYKGVKNDNKYTDCVCAQPREHIKSLGKIQR